ncbi:Crp/Fnr family transcriptional regulator [Helicobacter sp. 23-1044]
MKHLNRKIGFYHPQYSNSCKLFCSLDLPFVLREMADFAEISEASFTQILETSHIKDYDKDNIICYKDDKIDALFYLLHGSIKVYKTNKFDKEAVIGIYASECALKNTPPLLNYDSFDGTAKSTLHALEPCKILSIPSKVLHSLMQSDIALLHSILNRANSALYELNNFIEMNLMDTQSKVQMLMQNNPSIFKNVSKSLIASLLNISQETLSRALKELNSQNL